MCTHACHTFSTMQLSLFSVLSPSAMLSSNKINQQATAEQGDLCVHGAPRLTQSFWPTHFNERGSCVYTIQQLPPLVKWMKKATQACVGAHIGRWICNPQHNPLTGLTANRTIPFIGNQLATQKDRHRIKTFNRALTNLSSKSRPLIKGYHTHSKQWHYSASNKTFYRRECWCAEQVNTRKFGRNPWSCAHLCAH